MQRKKKEEILKEKKKMVNNQFCKIAVIQHYKRHPLVILTYMHAACYLSKNKQDEVAKKEDAVASYQAWKEKKAESLKAKAKEKQDMITKEQRAIEEKEEKKQSAKQVNCLIYCALFLF